MTEQNEPVAATTSIGIINEPPSAIIEPPPTDTGPTRTPVDPTWRRINRREVWFWVAVGGSSVMIVEALVAMVLWLEPAL
jgi:hypothetical protein